MATVLLSLSVAQKLIGTYRRFGETGSVYKILSFELLGRGKEGQTVNIEVLESKEKLRLSVPMMLLHPEVPTPKKQHAKRKLQKASSSKQSAKSVSKSKPDFDVKAARLQKTLYLGVIDGFATLRPTDENGFTLPGVEPTEASLEVRVSLATARLFPTGSEVEIVMVRKCVKREFRIVDKETGETVKVVDATGLSPHAATLCRRGIERHMNKARYRVSEVSNG